MELITSQLLVVWTCEEQRSILVQSNWFDLGLLRASKYSDNPKIRVLLTNRFPSLFLSKSSERSERTMSTIKQILNVAVTRMGEEGYWGSEGYHKHSLPQKCIFLEVTAPGRRLPALRIRGWSHSLASHDTSRGCFGASSNLHGHVTHTPPVGGLCKKNWIKN